MPSLKLRHIAHSMGGESEAGCKWQQGKADSDAQIDVGHVGHLSHLSNKFHKESFLYIKLACQQSYEVRTCAERDAGGQPAG